jgi:D-arabinose 1-dehydrogenase-like Zn-dependent alcohol dehydrogenase
MLAHWTGIAEMPADLDPVIAAPLLCAGVTMFNGIRHQTHLHPGDLVAIHGIGGLGHLGIQFAKKMGYRVVAISTSDSKKELAIKLGADHYIDVSETPASDQLRALGGASLIVTTSPNAESMGDLINGLGTNGRLMIVGADAASFPVSPFQLIGKKSGICGWASGTATDSEDTCRFAELTGVESINEVFPFEKAQEAYDNMCSGKCRFRVVIKMSE